MKKLFLLWLLVSAYAANAQQLTDQQLLDTLNSKKYFPPKSQNQVLDYKNNAYLRKLLDNMLNKADLPQGASPFNGVDDIGSAETSGGSVNYTGIIFHFNNVSTGPLDGSVSIAPITDSTLSRVDLLVANSNGTISLITGLPAVFAIDPTYSVSTQLPLYRVFVNIDGFRIGDPAQYQMVYADSIEVAEGIILNKAISPGVYVPDVSRRLNEALAGIVPGGGGHVIEDEGTNLAQKDTLNFVGPGVSVTNSGNKTVVTIPGGGATTNAHSAGYGLSGSSFDGSIARTWLVDTTLMSTRAYVTWKLGLKFDKPAGTTSQYIRGDGSLATFPTIPSAYTDEQAQDAAASLLTTGSQAEVKSSYNDAANKIDLTLALYKTPINLMTDLQALTGASFSASENGHVRLCKENGFLYYYDKDATDAQNFPSIIRLSDGVGRYFQVGYVAPPSPIPTSLFTGLEVWHSMVNSTTIAGASVATMEDISGNSRTGTVTGSGRTMTVESGINLKGITLNGSNDKITFTCGFNIRTVAVLIRETRGYTGFQEYYGVLSEPTASPNFSICAEGSLIAGVNSGARNFFNVGFTYATDGIQVDTVRGSEFVGYNGGVYPADFGPFTDYKLVIFELSAPFSGAATLQWGQERNSGSSRAWKGTICDGMIWNRTLTQTEKDQLVQYFFDNRKHDQYRASANNLFIDGNSYSAGTGTTSGNSFAYQTLQLLSATWTGGTFGLGSLKTTDMIDKFNQVVKPRYKPGFAHNVYVPIEVTNHLGNSGVTATQAYNAYVAICDLARSAGFTIIGATVPDRQDAIAVAKTNYYTDLATVNANIRTYHASHGEYVADYAADSRLSNAANTTYFNADKVHPNNTGAGVMASLLYAKIILLNSPDWASVFMLLVMAEKLRRRHKDNNIRRLNSRQEEDANAA